MGEFKFFSKIHVAGNCEKCKSRIENKVNREDGIYFAKWDMKSQKLEVQYDYPFITFEMIIQLTLSIGHDTENYKADDQIYESLPDSCQYRSD